MGNITQAQVDAYRTQGFLVLRAAEHQLVDPVDLQEWTEQVKNWPREKGKWMPYEEVNVHGDRQLMRTENFVDYHQSFRELLCGRGLAEILKPLSGDVGELYIIASDVRGLVDAA